MVPGNSSYRRQFKEVKISPIASKINFPSKYSVTQDPKHSVTFAFYRVSAAMLL